MTGSRDVQLQFLLLTIPKQDREPLSAAYARNPEMTLDSIRRRAYTITGSVSSAAKRYTQYVSPNIPDDLYAALDFGQIARRLRSRNLLIDFGSKVIVLYPPLKMVKPHEWKPNTGT